MFGASFGGKFAHTSSAMQLLDVQQPNTVRRAPKTMSKLIKSRQSMVRGRASSAKPLVFQKVSDKKQTSLFQLVMKGKWQSSEPENSRLQPEPLQTTISKTPEQDMPEDRRPVVPAERDPSGAKVSAIFQAHDRTPPVLRDLHNQNHEQPQGRVTINQHCAKRGCHRQTGDILSKVGRHFLGMSAEQRRALIASKDNEDTKEANSTSELAKYGLSTQSPMVLMTTAADPAEYGGTDESEADDNENQKSAIETGDRVESLQLTPPMLANSMPRSHPHIVLPSVPKSRPHTAPIHSSALADAHVSLPSGVEGEKWLRHCGRLGQPWWTALDDFVPAVVLQEGVDPRTGDPVYVKYVPEQKAQAHMPKSVVNSTSLNLPQSVHRSHKATPTTLTTAPAVNTKKRRKSAAIWSDDDDSAGSLPADGNSKATNRPGRGDSMVQVALAKKIKKRKPIFV